MVSTTAESTETHSSLDKKFERKHGPGKAGSVLGKAGSVYGISGGKGFTEVKCDSLAETSKKLQKVNTNFFSNLIKLFFHRKIIAALSLP